MHDQDRRLFLDLLAQAFERRPTPSPRAWLSPKCRVHSAPGRRRLRCPHWLAQCPTREEAPYRACRERGITMKAMARELARRCRG